MFGCKSVKYDLYDYNVSREEYQILYISIMSVMMINNSGHNYLFKLGWINQWLIINNWQSSFTFYEGSENISDAYN